MVMVMGSYQSSCISNNIDLLHLKGPGFQRCGKLDHCRHTCLSVAISSTCKPSKLRILYQCFLLLQVCRGLSTLQTSSIVEIGGIACLTEGAILLTSRLAVVMVMVSYQSDYTCNQIELHLRGPGFQPCEVLEHCRQNCRQCMPNLL